MAENECFLSLLIEPRSYNSCTCNQRYISKDMQNNMEHKKYHLFNERVRQNEVTLV